MAKWQKLLERLYRLDPSLRYDEIAKILVEYGYKSNETGGGSSHVTFSKKGCNPVTIPRHHPIKKAYIEIVRNVVMSEKSEIDVQNNMTDQQE